MNTSKVAASVQQSQEWARAEYEAKTKGLIFTKDFQSRQEALMHDPLATVGERVMAWILRYSWGEYRLFAMKTDGEPAYQRDICRALDLKKSIVSATVAYLQARGYLEDRPKKLYPVISPALAGPPPKKQKVARSQDFLQFIEQWKVAHSQDFLELEVARSTVEKIRKVILSEYKKSRKAKKSVDVSLLETKKIVSETGQRAEVSPFEADNSRHEKSPAQNPVEEETAITPPEAAALLFTQIGAMQKAFPESPFAKPAIDPNNAGDVGLLQRILKELGSRPDGRYDEQHVIGYILHITAQFKGWGFGGTRKSARDPASPTGPKSLGLLVNWAQDYVRVAGSSGYRQGAHT